MKITNVKTLEKWIKSRGLLYKDASKDVFFMTQANLEFVRNGKIKSVNWDKMNALAIAWDYKNGWLK